MKKPSLKDYGSEATNTLLYYVDLSAYWEHMARACLVRLSDIGEAVYRNGRWVWVGSGDEVGG